MSRVAFRQAILPWAWLHRIARYQFHIERGPRSGRYLDVDPPSRDHTDLDHAEGLGRSPAPASQAGIT